jgi:IS5 family transposase
MVLESAMNFRPLFSSFRSKFRRRLRIAGYAMVEANIAIALVGSFISGMVVVNGNLLGMLKSMKESSASTQALQERVEQMRIANWAQITDANYVSTKLMNSSTASSNALAGVVETITISAYPDPTVTAAVKVKRQGAATQVVAANSDLDDQRMVQLQVELTWTGAEKRPHSRATTALIAKGGISK